MKNLFFLALALPFFSFTSLDTSSEVYSCNHVTLSCGITYDICNFSGTMEQLMDIITAEDHKICGGIKLKPAPGDGEGGQN